jgi:hypothetical protein
MEVIPCGNGNNRGALEVSLKAGIILLPAMEVSCPSNSAHHPGQQVSNFIHPFAIGIVANPVYVVIT